MRSRIALAALLFSFMARSALAAPPCKTADLSIHTQGNGDAGLHHAAMTLVFQNKSDEACELSGSPRVTAQRAGGKAIAAAPTANGYLASDLPPPQAFVLDSGESASAIVEWSPPEEACPPNWKLTAGAPADKSSVVVAEGLSLCNVGVGVHAFYAGTHGGRVDSAIDWGSDEKAHQVLLRSLEGNGFQAAALRWAEERLVHDGLAFKAVGYAKGTLTVRYARPVVQQQCNPPGAPCAHQGGEEATLEIVCDVASEPIAGGSPASPCIGIRRLSMTRFETSPLP